MERLKVASETAVESAQMVGLVPSLADPKMVTDRVRTILKSELKEGLDKDYAVIPGTRGPSLLKPGAEKLIRFFGLYAHMTETKDILSEDGSFTEFVYSCEIIGSRPTPDGSAFQEITVGKYDGSANSAERCFFGMVTNSGVKGSRPNIRSRAMKRALVAVTRVVLNASDIFSQSEEDLAAAEERTLNPFDKERDELLTLVKALSKETDKDEWRARSEKALGEKRLKTLMGQRRPWAHITTDELKKLKEEFGGPPDDVILCDSCEERPADPSRSDNDGGALCSTCAKAEQEAEGQQKLI